MEKSTIYLDRPYRETIFPESADYSHLHIIVAKPILKTEIQSFVNYAEKFKKVSILVKHCVDDTYDLSFLESFPFLDSFSLTAHLFTDFEQLNSIPLGIKHLKIGSTNSLKLSLSFIQNFKKLKTLSLEKHKKNIEVISDLDELEELEIRGITMPNLEFIGNSSSLRSLRIALGGTKNLDSLSEYKNLEKLDLWAINKIFNIDSIADTTSLQKVYLDQLSNIENVKSLKNLINLNFLSLSRMKRLSSLQWVADAPNLQEFSITETTHLNKEVFLPLTKSESLSAASIYIGKKYTVDVRNMLGLPEIDYG